MSKGRARANKAYNTDLFTAIAYAVGLSTQCLQYCPKKEQKAKTTDNRRLNSALRLPISALHAPKDFRSITVVVCNSDLWR